MQTMRDGHTMNRLPIDRVITIDLTAPRRASDHSMRTSISRHAIIDDWTPLRQMSAQRKQYANETMNDKLPSLADRQCSCTRASGCQIYLSSFNRARRE